MASVKKNIKKEELKTNVNRPRVGVALSGGSARGIAHIGVLKALIENEIPIDCISGTSAGAIVAAVYAFDVPLDALIEKAKKLSWYSISGFPNLKLGLVPNNALEKIIEEFVGSADISKARIPLAIVATDIESGEKVVFRKGKVALAARASACLPGLFVPVEVDGRKLVDGGVTENLPLEPLLEMGADISIGVHVTRWHSRKKVNNILDVVSNAIDILADYQKDIPGRFVDVVIEPDLGAYSSSDFKKADEMVDIGYRAAVRKIPEIRRLLEEKGTKRKAKGILERFWDWLLG